MELTKRKTKKSNGLALWRSSRIFSSYLWNLHDAIKKNIEQISENFNNKFKSLIQIQHLNN